MIREFDEELRGAPEDYGARPAGDAWPFARRMSDALAACEIRVWCLGLGTDPLTWATDLLTVAVIDSRLFDQLFSLAPRPNDEGRVLAARDFAPHVIDRIVTREPVQAAGAAVTAAGLDPPRGAHGRGPVIQPGYPVGLSSRAIQPGQRLPGGHAVARGDQHRLHRSPAAGAVTGICIFIASSTTRTACRSTTSPGATATLTTTPSIGAAGGPAAAGAPVPAGEPAAADRRPRYRRHEGCPHIEIRNGPRACPHPNDLCPARLSAIRHSAIPAQCYPGWGYPGGRSPGEAHRGRDHGDGGLHAPDLAASAPPAWSWRARPG